MDRDQFIKHFGGIYEHSAWVAEQAYDHSSTELNDLTAVVAALRSEVDASGQDKQLALLRAHPDLAGRAALQGELTASSSSEQAGAGLDQCTPEEFSRFQKFNEAYVSRFEFPFIMAVKGANRHLILEAFEKRLTHSRDVEFETALEEVHKIAGFRLESWFEEENG